MLGLTLLAFWLLSAVVVVAAIWRAPRGFEDRAGWHPGQQGSTLVNPYGARESAQDSALVNPYGGDGGGRVPIASDPAADNHLLSHDTLNSAEA